jgi:hypothetical protein
MERHPFCVKPTQRNDRLKIAHIAADALAPIVRAHGRWHEPTIRCPAYFSLQYEDLQFLFAGPVQLLPVVPQKSWVFDIVSHELGKVLSVTWPPFELVSFRAGDWLDRLDPLVRKFRPDLPADWRFRRSRKAGEKTHLMNGPQLWGA